MMKEEWLEICKSYEGMLKSCIARFQFFYYLNVPWIQRILGDLTVQSLFTSPIFALAADNLFLYEGASSLDYRERHLTTGYLEAGVGKIVDSAKAVLLDDLPSKS